jgi:hypothetical protein
VKALPISEYHEDMGPVLWWKFPLEEAPYCGTPLDTGFVVEVSVAIFDGGKKMTQMVGGWPGYHTHFTPIEMPDVPG